MHLFQWLVAKVGKMLHNGAHGGNDNSSNDKVIVLYIDSF